MGRRTAVDEADLEQRPGESFQEWRRRLRDNPTWLRAHAEEPILVAFHPRRRRWLLDRADAIEAGIPVGYDPAEELGVRAG